jgi:hypothetical protein
MGAAVSGWVVTIAMALYVGTGFVLGRWSKEIRA